MTRRTNVLLALALSLSAAPACDEAIEGDFGEGDIALRPGGYGSSGIFLNTNSIGDHPLHEINRWGSLHEDVELKAVYVKVPCGDKYGNYSEKYCLKGLTQYVQLKEVWAEKGELRGRDINGLDYKGPQFIGSRWELNTYGGGLVARTMFVQNYRFDYTDKMHKYVFAYPNDPAYGVHFYTKKYKQIGETGLLASCAEDASGGIEAVVYENVHVDMKNGDGKEVPDILNLACLSGAIGKNSTFGYLPWDLGIEKFIAGVRMIRADYCGDGDSYTLKGTPIDVEDVFGINSFFDPSYKNEAMWTPKGAACVTLPRRPEFNLADIVCGPSAIPMDDCKDTKVTDWPDAVIWTKTPI